MTIANAPQEISLRNARLTLIAGAGLVDAVIADAAAARHGFVCVANVHQVTLAWRDEDFRRVMEQARYVSTDSRVIELSVGALGHTYSTPVTYAVDLLTGLLDRATEAGLRVGFYGGSASVMHAIKAKVADGWPKLTVTYAESPPVGTAARLATDGSVERIREAGVDVLLVGLGCPKQEEWMHRTAGQLNCMAVGVGAAFDFFADEKRMSPAWVRRSGLDWAWRLVSEPRRLWRRYLLGNSIYVLGYLPLVVRHRMQRRVR
ncbi:WecB/TagA/CpsF family glycosyltransferase [Blastococcus tunisiensis]|uniref:N-acetylglucosaminyldiphosphoundecaprenol N-acetyl-beta-D-mannosaminyltransferase n=1 Tax=Blastococcus tunisiensis TaxID=1798228 RepID=A0A1I2JDW1_9ACTN|nr:WecB/TagA/CpsF family glycosyltransferase [Blastococcus sp. DSM 46838]SFF51357.1 N-acetylglucosaminyldiphosphoundecaprenol N-acetyl-beta-D-mannosaminyltransferase [Blastococcus sp. DSM 46838]